MLTYQSYIANVPRGPKPNNQQKPKLTTSRQFIAKPLVIGRLGFSPAAKPKPVSLLQIIFLLQSGQCLAVRVFSTKENHFVPPSATCQTSSQSFFEDIFQL